MMPLTTLLTSGMKGEPMPYLLRSDWFITGILFLCLIIISYIISKGKKHLQQQLKSIFTTRERASLFDEATGSKTNPNQMMTLKYDTIHDIFLAFSKKIQFIVLYSPHLIII